MLIGEFIGNFEKLFHMTLELSEEQIQELKAVFDSLDMDKSGTLDKSEIASLFRRLNKRVKTSEIDKFLAVSDVDNDGAISFDEYIKVMKNMRIDKEKEIKMCFDQFDTNKNGTIERKEIYEVLRRLGENVRPTEVDTILESYDTNHDGVIGFEEFIRLFQDLNL